MKLKSLNGLHECDFHTEKQREESLGQLWNEWKGKGFELRSEEGMKEVDVSGIRWCQMLCHNQCQSHQPIPQSSATV